MDLFQTTDLWDKKNIALVTTTIFAVGRAVSVLVDISSPKHVILAFDVSSLCGLEIHNPSLENHRRVEPLSDGTLSQDTHQ